MIVALRVLITELLWKSLGGNAVQNHTVFIRLTFPFAAVCHLTLINSDVSQSAAPLQLRWD